MTECELREIEQKLEVKLPVYYKETMLNYPFSASSFAYEFALCADYKRVLDYNGVFEKPDNSFAIGADGGEYIFFIRLNEESKVYIFDLEGSKYHMSVEANDWSEYFTKLVMAEENIGIDIGENKRRTTQNKWWKF